MSDISVRSPAKVLAPPIDHEQPVARDKRTLSWLINRWRPIVPGQAGYPEWNELAVSTQIKWRSILRDIEAKWGTEPLSIFSNPRMTQRIVLWRDGRAKTPRSADAGITVLRALLKFGRTYGVVGNITDSIEPIYRGGNRAAIIWTDDDLERFVAKAIEMNMPEVADAVRLAAATGLRRGDLLRLRSTHIGTAAIVIAPTKSKKRRALTAIPRVPTLSALLEELDTRPKRKGVDTILVNKDRQPWNPDIFSKSVRKVANAIRLVHVDDDDDGQQRSRKKNFHDLRGTFCTRLMIESDFDDLRIAGVMGWAVERISVIRKLYVSDGAQAQALGERIQRGREAKRNPIVLPRNRYLRSHKSNIFQVSSSSLSTGNKGYHSSRAELPHSCDAIFSGTADSPRQRLSELSSRIFSMSGDAPSTSSHGPVSPLPFIIGFRFP
jgi:integrase